MPTIAAVIAALAGVAGVGVGVASNIQSGEAQKKAENAQRDAQTKQQQEASRLQTLAAEAPEKERQAELDKRRKRVRTLLSSQEETGMATVGTKTLLGG